MESGCLPRVQVGWFNSGRQCLLDYFFLIIKRDSLISGTELILICRISTCYFVTFWLRVWLLSLTLARRDYHLPLFAFFTFRLHCFAFKDSFYINFVAYNCVRYVLLT